jgi:alpha,alpha-trehalase
MDSMIFRNDNQLNGSAESWVQAVIFDLDGVVTDTAEAHARAWKQMFDDYLDDLAKRGAEPQPPFDLEEDYRRYVDGKPRYDGVRSFLASRGIDLETGSPEDPPQRETICGLGNRKNQIYQDVIDEGLVTVYPPAEDLIRRLRSRGIETAVVSSSKNCPKVLAAAGIEDLFSVRVDGVVSEARGLKGKPAPDIFLAAAAELKVSPERAVVVEDAVAGVEAGRKGEFGCVIGVDRNGRRQELKDHGADLVVKRLSDIDLGDLPQKHNTERLPSALDRIEDISRRFDGPAKVVFLDYDGTLSPIVDRPEDANLSAPMRETLRALANRCTVAIVSGRGLEDVRRRVGLEGLYYAGSHGFEIDGPDRAAFSKEQGREALPSLEEAESRLRNHLADIDGAQVERKKFSIAVHYRRVVAEKAGTIETIVDDVMRSIKGLRKRGGKKIFELQPDVEWDKGRAVLWLLDQLALDNASAWPIYIGDDVTDEDAFRVLQGRGAGIVVHDGEKRPSFARYGLRNPAEVATFLQKLATGMEGGQ